jgi:superfamily I DNA/RNA helicase
MEPDPVTFSISEDPEQDAVIADESPRLLIEAPPGTGKTRTAIRLAARDLDAPGRVSSVQRVLILTFSRHARAQLLRYAGEQLTPEARRRVEITNYHAFFWSKIEQFRQSLGLPLQLELLSEARHRGEIEGVALRCGASAPLSDLDAYARALEFSVPGARPPRRVAVEREGAVLAALHALHRRGLIHFDDMGYYMWRLVSESSTLQQLWAHKYPVVILDEYQDTAPLQAMIVAALAPPPHRVYAFADVRQLIYAWRDASPDRVREFLADGASRHVLRTPHRFRASGDLGRFLGQAREVLEGTRSGPLVLPREVTVIRYDPTLLGRGDDYHSPRRELANLVPILHELRRTVRSVAVMVRINQQVTVMDGFLRRQQFVSRPLAQADEVCGWLEDWLREYDPTAAPRAQLARLLDVGALVVSPSEDVAALRERLVGDAIVSTRLGDRRRGLAQLLNERARACTSLAAAAAAAREVAGRVAAVAPTESVLPAALRAVQTALAPVTPAGCDDATFRTKALDRSRQARMARAAVSPRGILVLTCHDTKSMEFDAVVLPFVSTDTFSTRAGDDPAEEAQLLYVALSRATRRVIIRVADGRVPPFINALGLA